MSTARVSLNRCVWPENVQSRDTFCLHRLSRPERFRRHLFDMPTMQPQHAMTAAGKSEIMRGYQEIFCDTCFQPLSFKSRSESASRGSNPPGAANTILRKSFVKSLNERDVAFVVGPGQILLELHAEGTASGLLPRLVGLRIRPKHQP